MHYNINLQTKTDRAPYFLPALSNTPTFLPGSDLPARSSAATCRKQWIGTPKSTGPLCQRQPQTGSNHFSYREHARPLLPRRSLPPATPTGHRQHGDPLYLMKKVILMQPLRYPHSRQQLRAEPDLEQVKADYLIHQIDQAFRLWTNSPWLEDLTFDDFLEYLLPYRIGNESLDYWRDSIDLRLKTSTRGRPATLITKNTPPITWRRSFTVMP